MALGVERSRLYNEEDDGMVKSVRSFQVCNLDTLLGLYAGLTCGHELGRAAR